MLLITATVSFINSIFFNPEPVKTPELVKLKNPACVLKVLLLLHFFQAKIMSRGKNLLEG